MFPTVLNKVLDTAVDDEIGVALNPVPGTTPKEAFFTALGTALVAA